VVDAAAVDRNQGSGEAPAAREQRDHMATYGRQMQIGDVGHDHLYCSYGSETEQRHLVARYLDDGLRRNERVSYICHATRADFVRTGFQLDLDPFIVAGQFTIEDSANTYVLGGNFAPDRMLAYYEAAIASAREDGYAGFRVAAEMDWARPDIPGVDQLVEYENAVSEIFAARQATALCQYNRHVVDAATLSAVAYVHPAVANEHPLYESATLRIVRAYDPPRLVLSGEIDLSNRGPFRRALAHLDPGSDGVVRIDGSSLRFLDVRSIGTLISHAATFPEGRHLELRLPARLCRLVAVAAGGVVPQLRLLEAVVR
jgi:hypothetical protein